MTREEILTAIREAAEKLGHPPTFSEMEDITPMRRRHIRKHFGSYIWALKECDLKAGHNSRRIPVEALFTEWATVARRLNKLPSAAEFEERSKYSLAPFHRRYTHWTKVPGAMREFALAHGLETEWLDVLRMIGDKNEQGAAGSDDHGLRPIQGGAQGQKSPYKAPVIISGRPIYGTPMVPAPLVHEPINEMGVVFLFGVKAAELGFMVTLIQTEFPDCEALREVAPRRWQRVRIEFEHESRNFLRHGHDVNGCDLIVCWIHNWEECPLEVVELRKLWPKLP